MEPPCPVATLYCGGLSGTGSVAILTTRPRVPLGLFFYPQDRLLKD